QHRLPASEPATARAGDGDEDKGPRLAGFLRHAIHPMAGRRGPTRREAMIMTQDKARKAAARQRMAQTGEPYSVARHTVEQERGAPGAPGEGGWPGAGGRGGSGAGERGDASREREGDDGREYADGREY